LTKWPVFLQNASGNPKQEECVKFLRKVKVTTQPYSCRECFVIYETAVICRRIGWFPVFCARRRTNGGGYAEVLNLLPFSIQEQWGGYILLYMPLCYLCSGMWCIYTWAS